MVILRSPMQGSPMVDWGKRGQLCMMIAIVWFVLGLLYWCAILLGAFVILLLIGDRWRVTHYEITIRS